MSSTMDLRDRTMLRPPVPPGTLRPSYRARAMNNVSLDPPPGHTPRRDFDLQYFPDMELRPSTATCNMVDEDPGYGLFLLEAAAARTVLTWYAQDIISFADAHRLQELGNRHIRVVTGAGHCLNSAPRPGRFYDYYAGKHQLAGFANSSNRPNAFLRDVGSYSILETYHALTPGPNGIEIFLGYNF